MHARDVGLAESDIVLGKHSGRHALRANLAEIGIHLEGPELDEVFRRFKMIADKKKEVTTADLEALVGEEVRQREDVYSLEHVYTSAGTDIISSSQVGVSKEGKKQTGKAFTGGSIESIMLAIDDAVGMKGKLLDYQVRSITSGKDSLGEVRVVVEVDGKRYAGQAVSIDVLEASAKAYVRALNNVAMGRDSGGARGDRLYL
jgi:2-isopropylmalate synthase